MSIADNVIRRLANDYWSSHNHKGQRVFPLRQDKKGLSPPGSFLAVTETDEQISTPVEIFIVRGGRSKVWTRKPRSAEELSGAVEDAEHILAAYGVPL